MPIEILIIRLSAIGDVVHSLPMAAALKSSLGQEARITWVVEPLALPLVSNNPVVDEVIVFPGKSALSLLNPLRQLRQPSDGDMARKTAAVKFWSSLRDQHFDVALEPQGLLKSSLIAFLSGAPVRIGFKGAREFSELLLTHRVDVGDYFGNQHHVVDLNLKLVDTLLDLLGSPNKSSGASLLPEFPLPAPKEESLNRVREWLGDSIYKDEVAVLIPATTWETKIWPSKNWVDLACHLKNAGYKTVIIGGAADKAAHLCITEELQKKGCPVIDLTGQTSILDLIALFQASRLVIGADTGPLHIAAATGVPKVLGIYGSTPWRRNGPYGTDGTDGTDGVGGPNGTAGPGGSSARVVALDLPCQPCFSKRCHLGTIACLKELTLDRVLAQVEALDYSQIQR